MRTKKWVIAAAALMLAGCVHTSDPRSRAGHPAQYTSEGGSRIADASISTVLDHIKSELLHYQFAYFASGVTDFSTQQLAADILAPAERSTGPCPAYSAPDMLRRGSELVELHIRAVSIKAVLSETHTTSGEGHGAASGTVGIALGASGSSADASGRTFELRFVPDMDIDFADDTQIDADLDQALRTYEIARRQARDRALPNAPQTLSDYLLEYAREIAEVSPYPPCLTTDPKAHKLTVSFSITEQRDVEAGINFLVFKLGGEVSDANTASNTITIEFGDNVVRAR